jgi:predicted MFS family arabinose efflux permease
LWVYVKPYGAQIGLNEATTGFAVSVAMGVQIVAGLLAIVLTGRVRGATMILFVAAASIASLALLLTAQSATAFIIGTAAFALLWMLVSPFHMPYLIDIDPSRRSALHATTSQLLGVAAGPALASMAVEGENVTGALIVAALLYGVSALIVVSIALRQKRIDSVPV